MDYADVTKEDVPACLHSTAILVPCINYNDKEEEEEKDEGKEEEKQTKTEMKKCLLQLSPNCISNPDALHPSIYGDRAKSCNACKLCQHRAKKKLIYL